MGKSWNSGDIHKRPFYAAKHTKEAAGGRFRMRALEQTGY